MRAGPADDLCRRWGQPRLGYLSALFQGIRALASTLTSNLYIKRLDLRDNGLCVAGAEALADVLCKNSVISGRC